MDSFDGDFNGDDGVQLPVGLKTCTVLPSISAAARNARCEQRTVVCGSRQINQTQPSSLDHSQVSVLDGSLVNSDDPVAEMFGMARDDSARHDSIRNAQSVAGDSADIAMPQLRVTKLTNPFKYSDEGPDTNVETMRRHHDT